MEKIEAYKCQYCGKLYKTATGCINHEEKLCTKHPNRIPFCYHCKHYSSSYDSDAREEITYYITAGHDGHEVPQFKKFEPNRCNLSRCKLYNNVRLSDELQEALQESGYQPMPTPQTGGCKHFILKQ